MDKLVQLKAHRDASPVIGLVVAEVEKLIQSVAEHPDAPVSHLFGAVPVAKKAQIVSMVMNVSTRADERAIYIAEQVFDKLMDDVVGLSRATETAKATLGLAIQFLVHSEFEDNRGAIGWQKMVNVLAKQMTEAREADPNRCCSM
eukprot:Skav216809  [mRNA]  locus=scaffold135:29841:30275:- [translate_table: standard]